MSDFINRIVLVVVASVALICSLSVPANAQEKPPQWSGFDAATVGFLQSHCVRCHNDEKQKGKFRLDNLGTDFSNPLLAEKWSEVRFRISAAEMPPPDESAAFCRGTGHGG